MNINEYPHIDYMQPHLNLSYFLYQLCFVRFLSVSIFPFSWDVVLYFVCSIFWNKVLKEAKAQKLIICPKQTWGCNCCQRCFNKLLSHRCKYLCQIIFNFQYICKKSKAYFFTLSWANCFLGASNCLKCLSMLKHWEFLYWN